MLKLMGVAAIGHVVAPTLAGAVPTLSEAASPKLFSLVGEHARALCSASSLEDAERLFEQNLDPFELSGTSVNEVAETEWKYFGVSRMTGNPMTVSTGEVRLLVCNRGGFH